MQWCEPMRWICVHVMPCDTHGAHVCVFLGCENNCVSQVCAHAVHLRNVSATVVLHATFTELSLSHGLSDNNAEQFHGNTKGVVMVQGAFPWL